MTLLYLGGSYLLIGIFLVFASLRRQHSSRLAKTPRILGLICLGLLPVLPYIVVEYRTWAYKDAILPAVHQILKDSGDSDQIFSLKVMSADPRQISVYVVAPCSGGSDLQNGRYGEIINLIKTKAGWQSAGAEDAVWSDGGTADGSTFPPYP